MKKEHLYEPYSVVFETLDEFPERALQHSFFELVYVIDGTGKQCINNNHFDYTAGHMFLITPQDCHSFEIETTTQFFFLRFNDIYLQSKAMQSHNIKQLEFILQNANHQPGCILKNKSDKCLVRSMVDAIIRERVNRDLYNNELIRQLVNTLIVIVARNIAKYLPEQNSNMLEDKIVEILNYIQSNIYSPEKIRTEVISNHFGISESYLGRYFKKHCNETMQSYITKYKIQLIETRLDHSDKRITEIANELGFTDESHLNKFFKNQKGMSPTQYRIQKKISVEELMI
ncbi:AraC family transcriptional regulator [Flavobacterium sp. '19STA2R22 D10 B1']|uniref:AraC family transcriptional regulator n=1 Tax=Flavobacterium aerium TaxID=3037261 RepID=UPI00278BDE8D|nr:AraC family transcriptional regulator [Flavobacterium sp. '19STA2R22 D10 B1']